MKQVIFGSGNHWTGLIARVVLGIVMLPHALQKAFGVFGGYGFDGTMQYFTGTLNFPYMLGVMIIIAEFVGSIALLAGLLTRFWALGMMFIMIGAMFMEHIRHGWFMNWDGGTGGEGIEYHILAIGLSLISLLVGAGKFSLDGYIAGNTAMRSGTLFVKKCCR